PDVAAPPPIGDNQAPLYRVFYPQDESVTSGNPSQQSWPAAVFKAYDIRGIVPDTINSDFARALGLALAEHARAASVQTVVVGRDGRLSGPELSAALQDGLMDGGVDVLDIGQVPTPLVYFAAHTQNTGSGVAITGSHNPPRYNGFKMMMAGDTLHGDSIQALAAEMQEAAPGAVARGSRRAADLIPEYIARIVGDVKLDRPLRIAIDCGNGVA